MGLSPVVIMKEVFKYTDKFSVYGAKSDNHIRRTNIYTVRFGSESIAN